MSSLKNGCLGMIALVVIIAAALTIYKASSNQDSPTKAYQSLHVATQFNDQQKRDTLAICARVERLPKFKNESTLINNLKTIKSDSEALVLTLPPGDPQTDLLRLIVDCIDMAANTSDKDFAEKAYAAMFQARKILANKLNDKMDFVDKIEWDKWCKDRNGGLVKPRLEK